MPWGVLPWVYPVWDSLVFLDLGDYFLPHFREVFNYYLLKYFLMAFLFVFSSRTPVILMLGHLALSQRYLRLSSFLLILLFFFFPLCFISISLSCNTLILSSASVFLLLVPSRDFWSHLLHYSSLIDFYSF